jgi:hypothetical protein
MSPKLHIVSEGGKFVIKDEQSHAYGTYPTKKQADDTAKLWRDYYEDRHA